MAQSDMSAKSSRFLTLASVVLVVAVLYFAQEVLVPIALAILLSFLLAPLVRRLEHLKCPRVLAVLVSVALALGIVVGVGVTVYNELADLAVHMPTYRSNIQSKIDAFRSGDSIFASVKRAREEMQHMLNTPATLPSSGSSAPQPAAPPVPVVVTREVNSTSDSSTSPSQLITSIAGKILSPVGSFFIVIVFTIFMLLEREDMRDRLISLVGRNQLTMTTEALDDAASRVSRYLLMQVVINGSVGLFVMIALWTIGKVNGQPFPSPALWGLLAALLRFIPYVGIWIAAATPLMLSLAVYPTAQVALETLVAFVAIELLAANVVEPLLFGASTGIATLAVLVAALFWTWLWGGYGLLLATPLTVCLVVIGKHVPHLNFLTILLGDTPPLDPPDRVYQRLLALDETEAADLVNEYGRKMPVEELYDTVLLPTLAMANRDLSQGNLSEQRISTIYRGLRDIVEELTERFRADAKKLADQAKNENGHAAATVQSPPDNRSWLPKGCTINVVCLPAHDEADEIAAMMFAHLLENRGYCSAVVSIEKLASERVTAVEGAEADLVCISSLPPAAGAHARYLCKRLQGKMPDLGVLIGLWTEPGDLKRAKERIGSIGKVEVASTFRAALELAHQMAQPRLLENAVVPNPV
jgi:predicted PurR-regulated permease PerM